MLVLAGIAFKYTCNYVKWMSTPTLEMKDVLITYTWQRTRPPVIIHVRFPASLIMLITDRSSCQYAVLRLANRTSKHDVIAKLLEAVSSCVTESTKSGISAEELQKAFKTLNSSVMFC